MGNSIFLIGFMGVGKTTIGKQLADGLGYSFIDTDEEIEKKEGNINHIFSQKNEDYFRQLESQWLRKTIVNSAVVSCGGGLPCFNDNILLLKKKGKTIWIDSPLEAILKRLNSCDERPLMKNKTIEEIEKLKQRRSLYYLMADIHIKNIYDNHKIISQILEKV